MKSQNTTWNDDSHHLNKVVYVNCQYLIHPCLLHCCCLRVVYSLHSCLVPYLSISTICRLVSCNDVFFISQWLMSAARLLYAPGGLIALSAESLASKSILIQKVCNQNNWATTATAIISEIMREHFWLKHWKTAYVINKLQTACNICAWIQRFKFPL